MKSTFYHITTGDLDGIGLEITLKSLVIVNKKKLNKKFIIWCSKNQYPKILNFISKNKLLSKSQFYSSLEEALVSKFNFNFLLNNKNTPAQWFEAAALNCLHSKNSVITAPLSKTQIAKEGFKDKGHTDILKRISKINFLKMCFVGQYFSTVLFTDHIPLNKVLITKADFIKFLKLSKTFHLKFHKSCDNLHVLGLNPHAGEEGLIGSEDSTILKYSKSVLKINHLLSADSAFVNFEKFKSRPTFLSCYHDQALIPFKMAHKHSGYQYTLGLPFVRTSVDHGTAKDIFNKNKANPQSMVDAILGAISLSKN